MYPPGSLGPGVFGPQAVQQPPQLQHPLGRHAVRRNDQSGPAVWIRLIVANQAGAPSSW